ncbi:short-chain dehydrogenase [Aspergillus similis]
MASSILITGGTTGLGYQVAINLARQFPNHHIVLASRTNTNSASDKINHLLRQRNVSFMHLDLSSASEVRTFISHWSVKNHPPIQYLLLNAGIQLSGPIEYTKDGYERTFAINHMNQALLLFLLMPYLAYNARIVITGSGTHDPAQPWPVPPARYTTAEELAHPLPEISKQGSLQFYSASKLASLMWMYALERRLSRLRESGKKQWTVATFDPGMMPGTSLARDTGFVLSWLFRHILPRCIPLLRIVVGSRNIHTAEESGRVLAWVVGGEEMKSSSGDYYEGEKVVMSSKESYDEEKQEELWRWTIKNIAENQEEITRFGMEASVY